jgi:hypothetical protein
MRTISSKQVRLAGRAPDRYGAAMSARLSIARRGPRSTLLAGSLVLFGCPGGGGPAAPTSTTDPSSSGAAEPTTTTDPTATTEAPPTTSATGNSTGSESSAAMSSTDSGTSGPAPDLGASSETDSSTGAAICPPPLEQPPGSWTSAIVPVGPDDALEYVADGDGNRIADFSFAGYHRGEAELPAVAMALALAPIDGDNTAQIQQAIDELGAMPPGPDGLRGAVVLAPGEYTIAGTVLLRHSGVVLRGAGDGDDPTE